MPETHNLLPITHNLLPSAYNLILLRSEKVITAGIDCGAKNTKTVILKDGEVIGKGMVPTGFDQEKAVAESLEKAIQAAGIARDDIRRIGGTGSGKNAVKFADDDVDDIKAMSKGAIFFFPNARTVVVRVFRPGTAESFGAVDIKKVQRPYSCAQGQIRFYHIRHTTDHLGFRYPGHK